MSWFNRIFLQNSSTVSSEKDKLISYLQSGLSQFWKQLYQKNIENLAKQWGDILEERTPESEGLALLLGFELLADQLEATETGISDLRNRHRIFLTEMSQETQLGNKHKLILEFCRYLDNSKIRGDRRALKRWLDESAISERWNSQVKDLEFYAAFLMRRMAALFDLLAFSDIDVPLTELWHNLKIENRIGPWIRYGFEVKVKLAAFQSISSILKIAYDKDVHLLSSELLRYTYRFALDNKQDSELQVEALHLLAVTDINKAKSLIDKRLAQDNGPQQMFFREAISGIICLHHLNKPEMIELASVLACDPSPLVRQSVVQTLSVCDDDEQIAQIIDSLKNDKSDAVFCHLATQIPYLLYWQGLQSFYIEGLQNNTSYLRLKALCSGLLGWLSTLSSDSPKLPAISVICEDTLLNLCHSHDSPKVQHLAMETREKIWARCQPRLSKLLQPILQTHGSHHITLSKEQQDALAQDAGKRWLAANIGHQFSIQLHSNKLYKGDRIGFRFWRLVYEFFNPATDKRQHHSHVTGRLFKGKAFIPSTRLAEVSQTTVPGEPLHYGEEGHWRPFLPLVDQFIASLDDILNSAPVVLHHVCGQTVITPPKSIWGKLRARTMLTWRFKDYASMRNVEYHSDNPNRFICAMRELGFEVQQNNLPLISDALKLTPPVPAVGRFFELSLPLVVVQLYQDFQRYFVSVYQNTINHILLFSVFMFLLFWGSHVSISKRFKKAREQIPLTIGGWGTRGKSGTERLKAALVNAMGLSTVSKTTGCEAMFLYATRYGVLKEMFLFRPYDKATIWEQTFVVRLAAQLKSDILCWECMGLTPRYIDILQQQWMQDDFITITNCFPDHEDLQGPAGVDVPQVIAKFIPPKSNVWTSEENMLAYLQKEAAIKDADLTHVDWLDIATIPEDLLARFPYEEHPANIALVAKMASEMQITRTKAIKEMADRVVPDIGVLQVFPYSTVQQRQLRFINGMSANERYGALANWQRLKYNDITQQQNGEFILTTAINNRADRVPRSKVFARLIAYDFSATWHFVIGNNLNGFHMFAMEFWEERLKGEYHEAMTATEFNLQLRQSLRFLMIAESEEQLMARMANADMAGASLQDLETQLDSTAEQALDNETRQFWQQQLSRYKTGQSLLLEERSQTTNEKISREHLQYSLQILKQQFSDKMILVDDYYISGNQLNCEIARRLPQNVPVDILGLQNIKGPGLDLVYSWQQWQRIDQLLRLIANAYGDEIDIHLTELAATPRFSCLDIDAVNEFVVEMQEEHGLQTESNYVHLDTIKHTLAKSATDGDSDTEGKNLWKPVLDALEQVVDIFDAINRGRKAKRVLLDLSNQRISLNRAAFLLQQINKRQKGGWLSQRG